MIKRFTDLLELELPNWIIDPFSPDTDKGPIDLQEELSDMHNEEEEKARFKMIGFERFLQSVKTKQISKYVEGGEIADFGIPHVISRGERI